MNPKHNHIETDGSQSSSFMASGDTVQHHELDDSIAFDLLESPQNWPNDPVLQAEYAELLEIHLAIQAHADDLTTALVNAKGFKRFISGWLLAVAAIAVAILPATFAVNHVKENRRMQARGGVVEVSIQKRLQAKLWSDFFGDSLDLLRQVKIPAKYCDPSHEDRSFEVEQARKLYAIGRSLSFDSLDDPEVLEAGRNLQNWLTEVSANDSCITLERSIELLDLAQRMDLEVKTTKLSYRLKEIES
ncbi:MAG: hypothetical protein FWG02_01540 [Holophagaceae bacterium]|nr:hypothetical protein [Holophagaceae bacterium]